VLIPVLAKRLLGNWRAPVPSSYLWRLLFDSSNPRPLVESRTLPY
jgi:hypothetical protein